MRSVVHLDLKTSRPPPVPPVTSTRPLASMLPFHRLRVSEPSHSTAASTWALAVLQTGRPDRTNEDPLVRRLIQGRAGFDLLGFPLGCDRALADCECKWIDIQRSVPSRKAPASLLSPLPTFKQLEASLQASVRRKRESALFHDFHVMIGIT